jgi:hypothetical protein
MISRDFHNGRVARRRLTNTSNPANLLTDGGTAQDAYYLPATHVQGLEARGDTFYLNTSNSQEHGVLHKTQRVGTNLTFIDWKQAAVGTEDLSYDTSQAPNRIFSLSEYYGRRAIYSMPAF